MNKYLIQWIGETKEDRKCLAQGYFVAVPMIIIYIGLNAGWWAL